VSASSCCSMAAISTSHINWRLKTDMWQNDRERWCIEQFYSSRVSEKTAGDCWGDRN
jgi:hypothetical protein